MTISAVLILVFPQEEIIGSEGIFFPVKEMS